MGWRRWRVGGELAELACGAAAMANVYKARRGKLSGMRDGEEVNSGEDVPSSHPLPTAPHSSNRGVSPCPAPFSHPSWRPCAPSPARSSNPVPAPLALSLGSPPFPLLLRRPTQAEECSQSEAQLPSTLNPKSCRTSLATDRMRISI